MAVITGDVLSKITRDLDGGDGVDTLDFSQTSGPVVVNLETIVIEIDDDPGLDAPPSDSKTSSARTATMSSSATHRTSSSRSGPASMSSRTATALTPSSSASKTKA
ncbi:MAG: hypothetical protein AAFP13_01685 [Pseudomonadota bacterium]